MISAIPTSNPSSPIPAPRMRVLLERDSMDYDGAVSRAKAEMCGKPRVPGLAGVLGLADGHELEVLLLLGPVFQLVQEPLVAERDADGDVDVLEVFRAFEVD